MKKIVLIAEFGQFGGTRTYFKHLINFYKDYGFNVVVIFPSKQVDSEIQAHLSKCGFTWEEIQERKILLFNWLFRRFPFNAFFDISSIYRFVRREKPQLIVASIGNPGWFLGLVMLPYSLLYILHTYPHGVATENLPQSQGVRDQIKKLLLSFFLTKNKSIVTVSNYAKERIVEAWLNKSKDSSVKVIYNTAGNARSKYLFPVDTGCKIRVLTLGHVAWYKNPLVWISVAKKVISDVGSKEVEFLWAGDGNQLDECRAVVRKCHLESNVKFVGRRNDIEELFYSTHIYFQPSIVESQGLSVIEAMQHGIPCVVSNAGGLPESVINNETGFVVNSKSEQDMADAITKLIKDAKLRKSCGVNALEQYKQKFDEGLWRQKMLELHQDHNTY